MTKAKRKVARKPRDIKSDGSRWITSINSDGRRYLYMSVSAVVSDFDAKINWLARAVAWVRDDPKRRTKQ